MRYRSISLVFVVVILFFSSMWPLVLAVDDEIYVKIDIVSLRESYRRAHGMQTVESDGSEWFRDDGAADQLWAVDYVESFGVETMVVYASSVLARVDQALVDTLRDAGLPTEVLTDRANISFRSYHFDIREGEPQLPSHLRIETLATDEKAYFLVKFLWPAKQEWLDDLEANGLEFLQYVPSYTYKVRGEGRHRDMLIAHPFVEWVGFYHPAYKLSSRLDLFQGNLTLSIVLHPGEDFGAAMAEIEASGARIIAGSGQYLRVMAHTAMVSTLAWIPAVDFIGPWEPMENPFRNRDSTRAVLPWLRPTIVVVAVLFLIVLIYAVQQKRKRDRS